MAGGNSGTDLESFADQIYLSDIPATGLPTGGTSEVITSTSFTESGGSSVKFHPYPPITKPKKAQNKKDIYDSGHRLRILQEIDTALEAINNAKELDDPVTRATQAFYLEDCLKKLWDMRVPRENEFKELVNLLYLKLKHISLENITNEQLDAFNEILDQILRRTVRKEDFDKAMDILDDLEPWSILASNE